MARSVTLGNGNVLVGLDYKGQVRDFYYPQVGHSNHVSGASGNYVHRIGVFVDGVLSWLDDPEWKVNVGCDSDTVIGEVHAVNDKLKVTISSTDAVHNELNIFLRSFVVGNEAEEAREIKLFLSQQFRISESRRGDTGYYDPRNGTVIHYKGHHKFLINATHEGKQFEDYNIGLFGIEGKDGTFHDAEDGVLERNPIEHGSVDSIIGMTCELLPNAHTEFMYWVACAPTIDEVHALNNLVFNETPEALIKTTKNYWQAWIGKDSRDLSLLSDPLKKLYNRSLATIRVHTDNGGGIIASSDTDMLHHGRDTYSYVWPRDASLIAHSLDLAGYHDISQKYFKFMASRLEKEGFLYHKYRVDGALGSSWHSWVKDGKMRLPIQEDETALTLLMLWRHYEIAKDLEFLESMYNPFIEPAAEFMVEYVEASLGLPDASFDLWEEKHGISTYTASAVCAALSAAVQAAQLLGKDEPARTYSAVMQRMRKAIMEHLYDDELGMFIKQISINNDGDEEYDKTVDFSSFFGPIYFGVVDVDDERVTKAFETVEEKLKVNAESSGYIRYECDTYYTMQEAGSPNPWVITTLWMAQYHIMKAKSINDLKVAYEMLEWTCSHAKSGGVLAEQMHPHTREHLSTSPLVWSHAEFVITVDSYIKKHAELLGDVD